MSGFVVSSMCRSSPARCSAARSASASTAPAGSGSSDGKPPTKVAPAARASRRRARLLAPARPVAGMKQPATICRSTRPSNAPLHLDRGLDTFQAHRGHRVDVGADRRHAAGEIAAHSLARPCHEIGGLEQRAVLDPGGDRPLEGPVPVGEAVGSEDLVEVDVRLDQRPQEDVPGEVDLLARRRLLALRRGRVDDLLDAAVRDDEVHDTSPGQERAAEEHGFTRSCPTSCGRHHSPPHSCDLIAREAVAREVVSHDGRARRNVAKSCPLRGDETVQPLCQLGLVPSGEDVVAHDDPAGDHDVARPSPRARPQ